MSSPLLRVQGLKTWFGQDEHAFRVVDGVNFSIERGQTVALLGESGCGKSMTALSILGLNPRPASRIVAGEIRLNNTDLRQLNEAQLEKIRGRHIAVIFQEPQSALNPVLTIAQQLTESIQQHFTLTKQACHTRLIELLNAVGIPDPERRAQEYPHQLSGGMKQRIMIAMALAGEPELLIADEPTTALDVTIQAQILNLLKDIQRQTGMAILLISHDLGVVAQMADHIAVMYAGQIVESANRKDFFEAPKHPYTQKLFASLPDAQQRQTPLTVIKGTVPLLNQRFTGCRFVSRCDLAVASCHTEKPAWFEFSEHRVRCHLYTSQASDDTPAVTITVQDNTFFEPDMALSPVILDIKHLKIHYPVRKGFFQRQVGAIKAVDGVDISLHQGETLALVGESGCGKSTVGKGILQLTPITAGHIIFKDQTLEKLSFRQLKPYRRYLQIIFQDPFSSMNPRMTVRQILEEGLTNRTDLADPIEREKYIEQLLSRVGLSTNIKQRYPHEFSGGQRQRICIARALAGEPEVIVCDEPTSALDVSVQAQILNLLKDIQRTEKVSLLFITHNIAVVDYLADRVAVMYLGRIVEQGRREHVLNTPKHPYTKALLAAVPDKNKHEIAVPVLGELPSPENPPKGCHFHLRCPEVMPICQTDYPTSYTVDRGHWVKCHLMNEVNNDR